MENASKALIIAGAILLAISLIGIGMFVLNSVTGIFDNIGMDEEAIAAYNQKFDSYMGTKVKGSLVRNLYDIVRNHNITNQDDESLIVTINGSSENLSTEKNKILAGKTYTVQVTDDGYDSSTGYIKNITITVNN